MFRQNRIVWTGLILAISLGLVIETLKSTRAAQDGSSWRTRIFGMQNLDDADENETFATRTRNQQAKRARSRLLKDRIAGLSANSASIATPAVASSAATIVAGPPIPNLTPLAPMKSAEDKKRAADAKKKKKKKKKSAAPEQIAAQTPPSESDDDKSKSSGDDVSGGSSLNGAANDANMLALGAPDLTETPETLEQWLAYILQEPRYDRISKLIKAHEMHTVDSEIFYEVATQMLADSRAKMHEYAIYALGTSPSLKSFILLESANANEPQGSNLKTMSRTNLQAYAKLENLRYLASVISGGEESSSTYEAMRLIQRAVADYKPKAATPPNGPTASSIKIARQFSSLVPALTRVSNIASDGSLRREASATLRLVQTIVGAPTPVAAN